MEMELFMLKTLMGFLNNSLTNLLLRNNILECNKFEMKALVIYDRGEGLWKIWEWGSVKNL